MKILEVTTSVIVVRIVAIALMLAAAALVVSVFITDGLGAGFRAIGFGCLILVCNNFGTLRQMLKRNKEG